MNNGIAYTLLGTGVLLAVIGLTSQTPTNNGGNGNDGQYALLTYTPAQFASMADELMKAKSYINDDEDTFYKVFESLQSADDLSKLIYVFGTKQWGKWPFAKDMNLTEWVKDTLSESEQTRVKAVYDKFNHPF